MIDIILYQDGLFTTPEMIMNTLTRNRMTLQRFKMEEGGVRIIFYSLHTAEHNQAVMSQIEQEGWGYDIILTPKLVLNEEILFEPGKVLEAKGLWNLVHAIRGTKVLFLRIPTRISSVEPQKINYEDLDDFDLTGTVVDAVKFKTLLHDITYPGYLTSDMVYFLLSMMPGYCKEMRYDMVKMQKPHHIASLVDFYCHIDSTFVPYHKTVDRRELLKKLRDRQE